MKKGLMSFCTFLLLLVASCKKNDTACTPGQRPPTCTCPQITNQVCGCNRVTYDNGCLAECEGITSYTFGHCN